MEGRGGVPLNFLGQWSVRRPVVPGKDPYESMVRKNKTLRGPKSRPEAVTFAAAR